MTDIIAALRKVKQSEFDYMVEGNGRQPAEVVDIVVSAIRKYLPPEIEDRLWAEVLNWYPTTTGQTKMMTDDNLGGPVSVTVKLWLGSWELITDALNDAEMYALAAEIKDQVAEYLGG